MFRYISLIWHSGSATDSAAADLLCHKLEMQHCWRRVADRPGVVVLATSDKELDGAIPLDHGRGVVIGTIFRRELDRETTSPCQGFSASESRHIAHSAGQSLLSTHWGRYVAILRDPSRRTIRVLRDPSGVLPCYITRSGEVHVAFSDISDCVALGIPLRIRLDRLAALTGGLRWCDGSTVFDEVTEILPGHSVDVSSDGAVMKRLWDPSQIVLDSDIAEPEAAIRALRQAVRHCVQTWAGSYPKFLLKLSGGLDSSIVASCLQQQCKAVCVNSFTLAPEGDERRFARMVASHLKLRCVERLNDGRSIQLGQIPPISKTILPASYVAELLLGEFDSVLCRDYQLNAIFQGGGGDAMFLQSGAEHSLGDYVYRNGVNSSFRRIAHDASRVSKLSVISLLRRGLIDGFGRPRWTFSPETTGHSRFLTSSARAALSWKSAAFMPSSLGKTHRVPNGKRWHIFLTSFPPAPHRAFKSLERPESVFPLLSQPIHEVCLKTPTHLLFHRGWDRSTARHAFAQDLPSAIVNRRAKGEVSQMYSDILGANTAVIKELLLDGLQVKHKILCPKALCRAFEERARDPVVTSSLTLFFEVELFARTWMAH